LDSTLRSIEAQQGQGERLVCVVDASDPPVLRDNAASVQSLSIAAVHLPYPHPPSLARQRNYALDWLPHSVQIVHFLDDDVVLDSGYFSRLRAALGSHPHIGGVGGMIREPSISSSSRAAFLRYLFLIDAPRKGRVLPSGHATSVQLNASSSGHLQQTEWLSGCSCSFRRSVLDDHRFDPALEGYSMLEDLDLSYRVGQVAPLFVVPNARLIHHRSPVNRQDAESYAYHGVIHRRWFVEKNLSGPHHCLAFWWSVAGLLLAVRLSNHPGAMSAYRGLWRGVRSILHRDHPLLS